MPRVLSVGQCGYDHGSISRQVQKLFQAEVVGASTFPEAVAALRGGGYDLVLVNRVSDRDGSRGLDLIRTLKQDPELSALPVMMVSDYAEAQEAAESSGALPGFGKSEISTRKAQDRLRAALGMEPPGQSGG